MVQEEEFLKNHGDKNWLKGIQFLPAKMRSLLHLNKILAHQPWFITTDRIKVCTARKLLLLLLLLLLHVVLEYCERSGLALGALGYPIVIYALAVNYNVGQKLNAAAMVFATYVIWIWSKCLSCISSSQLVYWVLVNIIQWWMNKLVT